MEIIAIKATINTTIVTIVPTIDITIIRINKVIASIPLAACDDIRTATATTTTRRCDWFRLFIEDDYQNTAGY